MLHAWHCLALQLHLAKDTSLGTLYLNHTRVTKGSCSLLPQGLCTGCFLCLEYFSIPSVKLTPPLPEPQFDHHSWSTYADLPDWNKSPSPHHEPTPCCTCNITFFFNQYMYFRLISASSSSPLPSQHFILYPTHSTKRKKLLK